MSSCEMYFYDVFQDLIKEETNFLNQLEKILSSGSKTSADAEELSEEQDVRT